MAKISLIIGRDDDPICRAVTARLADAHHPTLFLKENEVLPGLKLVWDQNGDAAGGHVAMGTDDPTPMEEICGVLARGFGLAAAIDTEQAGSATNNFINAEWHGFMQGWLAEFACPVVNRVPPEWWYKSYLSPLDLGPLARPLALHLPRHVVTSEWQVAKSFVMEAGGKVRYSPMAQPSTYLVGADELTKLEKLADMLPFYLEHFITGARGSVYVVAGRLVSDLPGGGAVHPPTAAACQALAAALGLAFCEVKLLLGDDARVYCLGVDRMPHLYWTAAEKRSVVIDLLARAVAGDVAERLP